MGGGGHQSASFPRFGTGKVDPPHTEQRSRVPWGSHPRWQHPCSSQAPPASSSVMMQHTPMCAHAGRGRGGGLCFGEVFLTLRSHRPQPTSPREDYSPIKVEPEVTTCDRNPTTFVRQEVDAVLHMYMSNSASSARPITSRHVTPNREGWRPEQHQGSTLTRRALLLSFSSFPMAATVVISLQIDPAILSDIAKRLPASVSPTHPRPGMRCLQPLSRVPASAQSATLCFVVGSCLRQR